MTATSTPRTSTASASSVRTTTARTTTRSADPRVPERSPRATLTVGLAIALASAITFGSSGAVGKSLINAGWTPAAAVTLRILVGAIALLGPALWSMRGRWHLLRSRRTWAQVTLFGLVAVAGCQLFYFLAVAELSVGVALMLEYLGPILVVGWLWLAHGQRPRALTLAGVGLAMLGLLLVLDVLGDVQVSMVGVFWGLLAAVGLAIFFIVGADDSSGLPPIAFATLGLVIGGLSLAVAATLGVVPFRMPLGEVTLAGWQTPWWVPVLWLGLVAAAFAYATGIVANRALRAKVASFVGLSEVLFAVLWAWLLLGEMPALIQLLGGALIVGGVVAVKLDEPAEATDEICVEPMPAAQD